MLIPAALNKHSIQTLIFGASIVDYLEFHHGAATVSLSREGTVLYLQIYLVRFRRNPIPIITWTSDGKSQVLVRYLPCLL